MAEARIEMGSHAREWGTVVAVAAVYTILRAWAAPEDATVAVANALDVVALEHRIDLFVEAAIQGAILGKSWLVSVLNAYYVALHLPPVLGLLIYTYVRRPDAWAFVRDTLITFTMLGLVIHIVYPVAPPWFVDGLGIGDTFASAHASDVTSSTVGNAFAAMPSMHFGWALAAGLGFALLARPLWARALGLLHPCLMGLAIVATGNHYILDAVASVLLLAVAVALVSQLRGWEQLGGLRAGPSRPQSRSDPSLPR